MIFNFGIYFCLLYSYGLYCDVGSEWQPTLQPNVAPGRELAATALSRGTTLQPIRILFSYQNLLMTTDQENILKTRIMNSVKNWFTSVLSVYPLSSNLILKIQKCNNAVVPQDHLTIGVPYDYILYIYGNTTTASYIARGGACTYDSGGYGNVLAGSFEINIANFFKSSVEDAVITSIHETTHALVFSSSLYSQYVMPNGTKWANPTTTVYSTNRGKNITLLTLPTVTQKAQNAFNCSTLAGVELEDAGGTGSLGTHWDMRIMPHDYMSPSYAYYSVLSDITLALFQDSGWYSVNFTYAQSIIWGKNQGCAWTDNKCILNGVAQFPGFCTNLNGVGCDVFRVAESSCYQTSYSNIPSYEQYYSTSTIGGASMFVDYCTYMYPYSNRYCQKISSGTNFNYYGETVGFNSRCVESTLLSTKYVFSNKYKGNCYTIINCTSTYANILVGTQTVQCPFTGGNITVSGYNGVLVCPSSSILCNEIPCLNACQGNGICNKGICQCNSGYGGNDCSITCDNYCQACVGTGVNNCTSCITGAFMNGGLCECTQNSVYNSLTNTCDCNLGYQYINSYCAACANYFDPSEVSAYFSADYLSVIIQFNRSVSSTTTSDCNKIFYKNGYSELGPNPSCAWTSSSILQVVLGKNFTIMNETIPINPQNILAAGDSCNLNIVSLSPLISFVYPYPSPIVSLQAPSTYSLSCSSTDLIISGDQSQYTYKYYWSAAINPANSALQSLIASQTASKFTISRSSLSQSTLNITLTVANFFGANSTGTTSIFVIQNNSLTVTIDSGSFVYTYQTKQSQYKIMVSDFCNYNEPATYSWSYVSKSSGAPSLDYNSILSNSLLSNVLLINPNQISAGYSYTFNATVTEGSATGWCTLLITVLQSNLMLILSQTSGVVYNGNTLTLDASKSYDPDNSSLLLNYTWNCFQDGSYCKNSAGGSLIAANTSSSILSILGNNLLVNASYSFHVTIQEYSRNTSGIIDITIASGSGSLIVSNPSNRINSQSIFTIYSTVSATEIPIFAWSQIAGPTVTASIASNYSYISFPAYSLTQGSIYTYRVTMTYITGSKIYSDVTWTTDFGPTCSGVSASLNSDNSWLLLGNNCTGDSNDYPLTFSFYITIDNYNYSLSTPSQSSYFKTNLPAGNWQIILSVCTSLGTCNSYTTNVSVSSSRQLQSSSGSFNVSSKNPDEIPSSIIYYSLTNLDDSTLGEMVDKFENNMLSQGLINPGVLNTAISTIRIMLLNIDNVNSTTIFITMKILETILVNYNYTLTDQQANDIVQLYSPYFSDYIYYYQLRTMFKTMASKWLKNAVPGMTKFNDNPCLIYLSRLFPQNLQNSTITISNRTITTPSTVLLNSSNVYDIAVAIFPLSGNFSDVVNLQFYTSGLYENYGLSPYDNLDEVWLFNSSDPIKMQISLRYNYTFPYQCSGLDSNYTWNNDSCALLEIKNYSATVDIFNASTFKIGIIEAQSAINASDECGMGHGPFIALAIIIFVGILLVCIFSLLDYQEKGYDGKRFWENWALASLFIRQNSFHRVQMVLQIMSVFLFELFLCGVFYRVFDDPYESSNQSFEDYSEGELIKVLLSLVIGQSLAMVLTILNSFPFCDSKPRIVSSLISGILSLGSVFGILMLSYTFCSKYSDFWIIDFLIDIPIDLFIFQPLWSLVSVVLSELMRNNKSFQFTHDTEERRKISSEYES